MGSHRKIVIALGGNALEQKGMPPTAEAQLETVKKTCDVIADIKCLFGYEMIIAHGNGPQVGRLLLATEAAAHVTPPLPLNVCTAMTQAYIGFHIQKGLSHALAKKNRILPVVTLITQVIVDRDDPAFTNPTKPIGPFYSEQEAHEMMQKHAYIMKPDADRGWRRVVASPMPKRIVEIHSIRELWDSTIVVTVGGGGIPVIENPDGSLEGVFAVIDKDLAAEKLAEEVGADILLILTEVEKVCLNYHKESQQELDRMTVSECERYIAEGHFAPGSMLPKIEAAVTFAKSGKHKSTIITSLDKAVAALRGETGTTIVSDEI